MIIGGITAFAIALIAIVIDWRHTSPHERNHPIGTTALILAGILLLLIGTVLFLLSGESAAQRSSNTEGYDTFRPISAEWHRKPLALTAEPRQVHLSAGPGQALLRGPNHWAAVFGGRRTIVAPAGSLGAIGCH